jgi:polyphosphate kinase 2 (PPK2 family)
MNQRAALMRRIHAELIDGYDEELELEIEDQFVDDLSDPTEEEQAQLREDRRTYFKELFHLQGELVKLQDWVVATGHKAVIVFEGRDAAGKGGVIKRIMQRLEPSGVPRGGTARTQRPRAHAVVLSALCAAPACRR